MHSKTFVLFVLKINLINKPDFRYEKRLWNRGFGAIAGCDEVGRGCFAGPVVAAAVVFPKYFEGRSLHAGRTIIINDSKKMSARQRERASFWIKRNAIAYGIGKASVSQINRFGIKKASEIAFRIAITNARRKLGYKDTSVLREGRQKNKDAHNYIDFLLVDAFYIPYIRGLGRENQLAIVKGDEKSYSIKRNFLKYEWYKNKGYGTKKHREAIAKYGLTSYHRLQFVQTFLSRSRPRKLFSQQF